MYAEYVADELNYVYRNCGNPFYCPGNYMSSAFETVSIPSGEERYLWMAIDTDSLDIAGQDNLIKAGIQAAVSHAPHGTAWRKDIVGIVFFSDIVTAAGSSNANIGVKVTYAYCVLTAPRDPHPPKAK